MSLTRHKIVPGGFYQSSIRISKDIFALALRRRFQTLRFSKIVCPESLTLIRFFGTITERDFWKKIQNHRWWRHSWGLENENNMRR